jgi:hypothetical protein
MNPLRESIKRGVKDNDLFKSLFLKYGVGNKLGGEIQAYYANAYFNLQNIMLEDYNLSDVLGILRHLYTQVLNSLDRAFLESVEQGKDSASEQLSLYGFTPVIVGEGLLNDKIEAEKRAILAQLEAQIQTVQSYIVMEESTEVILGHEDSPTILNPNRILTPLAFGLVALSLLSFSIIVRRSTPEIVWDKMAVATLDNRTTPCCLHVHGQVVAWNKPFHTSYPPAYADYIDYPPFHPYCRTSVVLYSQAFDDGVSQELANSADVLINERNAGLNIIRNPSSALGG